MSFFGFGSTPLTSAIDRATNETHPLDDLPLHLEICDMINETEPGAQDAVRTLKKKLVPKSPPVVLLKSLTVLELCVKNCGRRFHVQVANPAFVDTMTQLATSTTVSNMVREKTLELIQSWADAFQGDMALQSVPLAYRALQARGVEFPAQDLDQLAPIYTPLSDHPASQGLSPRSESDADASSASAEPQRQSSTPARQLEADEEFARRLAAEEQASAAQRQQHQQQQQQQPGQQQQQQQQQQRQQPTQPSSEPVYHQVQRLVPGQRVQATDRQVAKLRGDLDVVRGNLTVLGDMLAGLTAAERCQDNPVIEELGATCEVMRDRASQLVDQIVNEDLIGEIIEVIDTANTVLDTLSSRMRADASKPAPPQSAASPATTAATPSSGYRPPMGGLPSASSSYGGSSSAAASAASNPFSADGFDPEPASYDPSGYPVGSMTYGGPSSSSSSSYAPAANAATTAATAANYGSSGSSAVPEGDQGPGLTPQEAAEIESMLSYTPATGGAKAQPHPEDEEFDMFANARQATFKDLHSAAGYMHEPDTFDSDAGSSLANALYSSARNPEASLLRHEPFTADPPASLQQPLQPQPSPASTRKPNPASSGSSNSAPIRYGDFGNDLDEDSIMTTRSLHDPPSFQREDNPYPPPAQQDDADSDYLLVDLNTPTPTSLNPPGAAQSLFTGAPAGQVAEKKKQQMDGVEDDMFGL